MKLRIKKHRVNINISDEHMKMLKPLIERNEGNFSAAIRGCIEFTTKYSPIQPGDKIVLRVEEVIKTKIKEQPQGTEKRETTSSADSGR